jgi:hypothetical protein
MRWGEYGEATGRDFVLAQRARMLIGFRSKRAVLVACAQSNHVLLLRCLDVRLD